jgi:predicted HNH restriction endonuclease
MSLTAEASERQRKAAQTAKTEPKWAQETAFPIIASAIERLYRDPDKFLSRREIVRLLLHDVHSRDLIGLAYKRIKRKQSLEDYAGNMIDWFSQRWTVGDEKWSSLFKKFERSEKKIDGCWAYKPIAPSAVTVFPDDVEEETTGLPEGAVFERLVNAYERNPLARQRCIKEFGTNCSICGFSFGARYGEVVDGLIHVHHLLQLSKVGKDYKVDPIADLRPVCPNCHAVIHHRNPPYSIEEVQSFLAKVRT